MATGTTLDSAHSAPPVAAATAPRNPDAETIADLRAAVLVLARRLRRQRADDDLSATEVAVLGRIYRKGSSTPGALARAEHVQPPSMTRIIERLEQRGYLRRDPDPSDGRQVLVSGTARGQQFIEDSRAMRTRWLAGQIDKLDETDRAALDAATPALARLADLA
jgi:DNA-binding MarR family transcriptional regulator